MSSRYKADRPDALVRTYPILELTEEVVCDLGMLSRCDVSVEDVVEHAVHEFFGYSDGRDFANEIFFSRGFYECGEQQQEDHRIFLSIVEKIKTYLWTYLFRTPPEQNDVLASVKASRTVLVIKWVSR